MILHLRKLIEAALSLPGTSRKRIMPPTHHGQRSGAWKGRASLQNFAKRAALMESWGRHCTRAKAVVIAFERAG